MSRTKREPALVAAVRDSMLDAATSVFASKGYTAATMKDIALEANYTAPALYNYFKGKEELFDALVERTTRELLECFDGPPPEANSTARRVEVLTRRLFALVDRRSETLNLLDSLQNGQELTVRTRSAMRQQCGTVVLARLVWWLGGDADTTQQQQAGVQLVATFYVAVIRAVHATWRHNGLPSRFEDQTASAVDLFLHGIAGTKRRGARKSQ